MKQGISLEELARQISNTVKQDTIVRSSDLQFNDANQLTDTRTGLVTNPNSIAHEQIGSYLEIPKTYYGRLRENFPSLLRENVNTLFRATESDEKRMVRMVQNADGTLTSRALLSSRYKRLDNDALLNTVLPEILDNKLQVVSSQVTDKRMYLQVLTHKKAEIKTRSVGDVVQSGFVISNSEVRFGSMSIQPLIYTLACTNGAVRREKKGEYSILHRHIGKAYGVGNVDFTSTHTDRLATQAFWSAVKDALQAIMSAGFFDAHVEAMQRATDDYIDGDIVEGINEASKVLLLSDGEKNTVLEHFVRSGDLSRYGLFNAVTRTAQDVDSYDRAIELQTIGNDVLTLPANSWRRIAQAHAVSA